MGDEKPGFVGTRHCRVLMRCLIHQNGLAKSAFDEADIAWAEKIEETQFLEDEAQEVE